MLPQSDRPSPKSRYFSRKNDPGCRVHYLDDLDYQEFLSAGEVELSGKWLADDFNEPKDGPCIVTREEVWHELWSDDPGLGLQIVMQNMVLGNCTIAPVLHLHARTKLDLLSYLPALLAGEAAEPDAFRGACEPFMPAPGFDIDRGLRLAGESGSYSGFVNCCACEESGCGSRFVWVYDHQCVFFLSVGVDYFPRIWLFPEIGHGPYDKWNRFSNR